MFMNSVIMHDYSIFCFHLLWFKQVSLSYKNFMCYENVMNSFDSLKSVKWPNLSLTDQGFEEQRQLCGHRIKTWWISGHTWRGQIESVAVAGTQGSAWLGKMRAGWPYGQIEEKSRALGSSGYKTRRTRGTRLQGQWRRSRSACGRRGWEEWRERKLRSRCIENSKQTTK